MFMKIAVTYDNGLIYTHYSRTPALKIYQVVGGRITDTEFIQIRGFIRNNQVDNMLRRYNVDVLICDRIGVSARVVIAASGIKIVDRQRGSADLAVAQYLGIPFAPPMPKHAPRPAPRPVAPARSFAHPRAHAPKPVAPPKPVTPPKANPPKPAPGRNTPQSKKSATPPSGGKPSRPGKISSPSRGGGFRK